MIIQWPPNKHPHEDAFEDYAFDRLSTEAADALEEHLLICEQCQDTLARTDEYIVVMKAATAAYLSGRIKPASPNRDRALRRSGLRWNIATAAVLLLTCLTALLSWRSPAAEPAVVPLEAYRGESAATNIHAPAGRPLHLKIDMKDIRPASGYRVEVVDATGRRVWFGGTPARLEKGLAPGNYWVRLFTDSGELLREFGLSTA